MSPREQIVDAAVRLFFTQGYSATGINQLIDVSGVAKRTFYHHFPSKEALGEAYLDLAASRWLAGIRDAARGRRTPLGVVRAVFDFARTFADETHFRGCGILNLAAEFADAGSAMRGRVAQHKEAQRATLRDLLVPLGASPTDADAVHVLLEGAIAGAAAHRDVWPIRAAEGAATAVLQAAHPTPKGRP